MIEDGTVVLAWRDLSGDPGDVYKFICDPSTPPELSHSFELVGTSRPSQDLLLTVASISMHVGEKVSQVS